MIFLQSCALSAPSNEVLALCLEMPPMLLRAGEGENQSSSQGNPLLLSESGETSMKIISVQLGCLVGKLSACYSSEKSDQESLNSKPQGVL